MRKKRNAFTLIELLAVIVILAVILVIAIPRILDVIDVSKKDSFKTSAQLIADSAEKKYVENKLNNIDEVITCENVTKLSKEDYESCKITFDNEGNAKVTIEEKGKFKDLAICNGTKTSVELSDTCSTDAKYFAYEDVEGGISITGYSIEGGVDVVIPSNINGKQVVSIGNTAFCFNKLTSVTIPSSVTSIGYKAFFKNDSSNLNLTKIINKTGKSFDWGYIVNNSSGYNFVTGTVVNSYGNVEVVNN